MSGDHAAEAAPIANEHYMFERTFLSRFDTKAVVGLHRRHAAAPLDKST
jgi:hypothetical protein